ncbi:MAG TPA: hypothetical protein DEA96_05510 [Leptospiraceae bacterium]|nr:hypothetical protein [Spirochaetaceae bacterium]HBS04399.1 hypothetical protein [Leptospiraceae bacterium]
MDFPPLSLVFIAGIGAAVFGAAGILGIPRKHESHYLMLALLLLVAIGMLPPAILSATEMNQIPIWIAPFVASQWALGPILFAYFRNLINNQNGSKNRETSLQSVFPHALLPGCALLLSLFLVFGGGGILQTNPGFNPEGDAKSLIQWLATTSPGLLLIYTLLSIRQVMNDLPGRAGAVGLLILLAMDSTLILVSSFMGWVEVSLVGNAVAVILLIFFGFLLLKQPFIQGLRIVGRSNSQFKLPAPAELKAMQEHLAQLLESERIFLDEDLDQRRLAEMMEINEKQLRGLVQHIYGVGFLDLLRRYRISEAKRLLLEQPDRSILSITYASGFNSRSVFYEAFRKETGQTPSQFRKKSTGSLS